MTPAFLTTRELAATLNVCEHTILRQAKRGKLAGVRVGKLWRFPVSVLEPKSVEPSKAQKRLMRML